MSEKKHWLRPLKGRTLPGRHLLLWVEADESRTKLVAKSRRAWDFVVCGKAVQSYAAGSWQDADDLERILDVSTKGRGTLTIWICRGWEDLILTGLAALLDCAACQWRYAMLDGHRILIRGTWRGKSITITSLANWTGSRWDAWDGAVEDVDAQRILTGLPRAIDGDQVVHSPGEHLALHTLASIFAAAVVLGLNTVPASSGNAAMATWRRWLGPRIEVEMADMAKKGKKKPAKKVTIVAPSPFRPQKSQAAERHCCYGHIARQLGSGAVEGPIYCLDIRSAYLLALCTMPIPLQFLRTLHRPSTIELAGHMEMGTGHALVRIQTDDYSYPVRRGRRVFQAIGHYWTWLAGHELAAGLCAGHITEIHTAYVWKAEPYQAETATKLLGLASLLKSSRRYGQAAAWRAVYSSVVGHFAARRKTWCDVPPQPGFERWCEWQRADRRTGRLIPCRSIAGRQQELQCKSDTSAAVPLLFACVSSFVHYMVQRLSQIAGIENCYQLVADSLWVSPTGWQNLQRQCSATGCAPDNLSVKAVYDRAWFSGRHVCVVERKGRKFLRAPGVGDMAALDEAGRIESCAALPWSQCESLDPCGGTKRRKVIFPGQKVIDKYSHPFRRVEIGERMDDPMLPAELLEPVDYERTVRDA